MKFFIVIISLSSLLMSEALKISFSRSISEPYVHIDKRELKGGVLKELMDAVMKKSGIEAEYILISQRNQEYELHAGNIDAVCLVSQSDVNNASEFQWSSLIYTEEDILIVRKDDAKVFVDIHSLYGHKVGTISAHAYPHLDPYFNNDSIIKVENKKLSNNINQLRFGVIDAVIDTKLAVWHSLQKKNLKSNFAISKKAIDTKDLHCAFRKDMKFSLEKINTSLNTLKEKGVIEKILNKYKAAL